MEAVLVTTGSKTCSLLILSAGCSEPFVGRRLRPWRVANVIVIPAILFIGPDLQSKINRSSLELTGRQMDSSMDDQARIAELKRHWYASDAGDFVAEHEIYREDAVLVYPQSGEQIQGRHNIQQSRFLQPNQKRFTVRKITGCGDLWVTEYILKYDDHPTFVVSIMEFRKGLVIHETQYFSEAFDPGASRAHLVEPISEPASPDAGSSQATGVPSPPPELDHKHERASEAGKK